MEKVHRLNPNSLLELSLKEDLLTWTITDASDENKSKSTAISLLQDVLALFAPQVEELAPELTFDDLAVEHARQLILLRKIRSYLQ
jgi:hypothetical protein